MKRRERRVTEQRLDSITMEVRWTDRANCTTKIDVNFWSEGCEADLKLFVEAIRKGDYTIHRKYVASEVPT